MTSSLPPEAAAYLEALRAEFADLPPDERDDVLADVETSLVEASAEGEGTIVARLGPPSRFAAELRAAAGIPSAAPASSSGPSAFDRAATVGRSLVAHPSVASAGRTLRELAPIWWLARAYVAAGAVALVAGVSWAASQPDVPHFSSITVTVAGLLALVVASLWLGVRGRRGHLSRGARTTMAAVNIALAVAAVPVAVHAIGARAPREVVVEYSSAPVAEQGLFYNGTSLHNLYPYTRSGRLLQDVLLYDEYGEPVNIGGPAAPDPDRRVLVSDSGAQLFNSFPIRYFEPRTTTVAHPYAAPAVTLPQVETPKLVRNN